ncbi:MAG: PIN domain-containing protein [SAR324 cluster bacterium]|nr:PIN domain-containing protein [SAR324 cluster bacterium]
MSILIDTSVWIDYFRSGIRSSNLDVLIDENLIVTNDIILVELIPFLKVKRQFKVIDLLNNISKLSLNIDWNEIIRFQVICLHSGLNGIGIPDLILAQNIMQNHCSIYSFDKHFVWLKEALDIELYETL